MDSTPHLSPAEAARRELLRALDILDTPAEPAFDALVRAASLICECPMSLISLVDADRQWFKAAVGLDAAETPRDVAFCAHAIEGDTLFEIPNAAADARFADNPLVTGDPSIRFYAGQPLVYEGVALGTLCVVDQIPRTLSDEQRAVLAHLSLAVVELLRGRREAVLHRRETERLQSFARLSGDWLWECDARHRCTWLSDPSHRASTVFDASVDGPSFRDAELFDGFGRGIPDARLFALLDRGVAFTQVVVASTTDEGRRFISLAGEPMHDADGRVTGYRGSAADVTARIESERLIWDRESALQKIASQLPGVVYQFRRFADRTSCFPYASERLRDLFEVDPTDVLTDGAPALARVHPDDLASVRESVDHSCDTGALWHSRFRVCLPVKGIRWLEGSAVPEALPDGSTRWHGYFHDVTETQARDRELVDAHAALQSSERTLRALTDNLPALISHVDADGRYTFANAHTERMLGGHVNPIGRTVLEINGPEVHAVVAPQIERVMRGERVSFEGTVQVDGAERHYHAIFVPDLAPDETVRGFFAMSFNITARKRAEMRLAASERMLRGVTDHLPALVSYIDRDRRYRFANATYRTWLGMDHVAMIGKSVRDTFDPRSVEEIRPYITRAWTGERVRYERHDTSEGRDAHHLVDYIPDLDDDGTVIGMYVMSTDITRLKRAEQARARTDQRLRDITDNLPVLITHMDADQRMTYANDTFLDWVGTTRERLIGRTVADVVGAGLYAQREDYIRRALGGERVTFEIDSLSGGEARHLQATYLPDFGDDGRVAGITTLSVDVTALKAAQLRLSQLAHRDALTGLPNRLHFDSRLADLVSTPVKDRGTCALMFLDIDHFKAINDAHGHATGDAVLIRFASRVQASVRTTDFVARLAGDEFVVLLAGLGDRSEAEAIARKIVRQVDRPFDIDGRTLRMTASVGLAFFADTSETGSEIMARADAALYRAKEAGRNTFRLAA